MKINTKKCTPINKNKGTPLEEGILHPNKYILHEESKKQDNDDATVMPSSIAMRILLPVVEGNSSIFQPLSILLS
jgi:hypothetical protein